MSESRIKNVVTLVRPGVLEQINGTSAKHDFFQARPSLRSAFPMSIILNGTPAPPPGDARVSLLDHLREHLACTTRRRDVTRTPAAPAQSFQVVSASYPASRSPCNMTDTRLPRSKSIISSVLDSR
jgi:hypothetical protein